MRRWASHSAAWDAARENPEPPSEAMHRFAAWVKRQHDAVGLPVLVA